ncbi:MAG: CRISPR-associated, partial [Ignavibacteria bacterium]
MNNSKIYFLFSIGPVQEFIAAGRKTRDLFSGSLMLSYLSAKALEAVRKHANTNGYNAVAVFPSLNEEENYADSSVPNRFLFSITEYSVDKITNTAEAAENAIHYEFDKIVEHAKSKFATINERDKVWATYWDEQKNNFLEIYWAAMETNEDYSMIYNRLENLMGQRKALRNFNELNNGNNEKGQPGLKCSLIQNLSVVHPTKEKPNDFWRDVVDKYPHLIGDLTGKEPLSAIALAKRFFIDYLIKTNAVKDGSDKYPSTTTIAVSTFNKAIINNYPKISDDAKSNIKEFVKAVRALQEAKYGPRGKISITNMPFLVDKNTELKDYLKIEGDFLLEEMVKNEFKSNGHEIEGKIKSVNETAKQIIKEVKKISGKSISKYYAIIYF